MKIIHKHTVPFLFFSSQILYYQELVSVVTWQSAKTSPFHLGGDLLRIFLQTSTIPLICPANLALYQDFWHKLKKWILLFEFLVLAKEKKATTHKSHRQLAKIKRQQRRWIQFWLLWTPCCCETWSYTKGLVDKLPRSTRFTRSARTPVDNSRPPTCAIIFVISLPSLQTRIDG